LTGILGHFHHRLGDFALAVDLECPGKGVTALFGPSGSGKTTILRCIAGLERVREGKCLVNGEAWQDTTKGVFTPPHRRAVGYVFQEANLFPHLSVRRNLEYGWQRVGATERKVDIDPVIEMMGIAELLERNPRTLSGGEKQRVSIARALLASPRLLLMDEPLASLDQSSKREIFPYLERLHTNLSIPVLYVSHDAQEISRVADWVALVEKGKIVAFGDIVEMMTRLDLSLARGEQAMAVLDTEIVEHDDEYGLTQVRFAGGALSLPQLSDPIGAHVRVGILARDASLALRRHTDSSILNIIPARVIEKSNDGDGHVLVRLDASGARLLARITRKSAHHLDIRPGMNVFVQVKSVAIVS
jgi:molybdate transport system ATP-binding protein